MKISLIKKSLVSKIFIISRLYSSKTINAAKLRMNFQLVKSRLKLNCPSITKSAFTAFILWNDEKCTFKGYLR